MMKIWRIYTEKEGTKNLVYQSTVRAFNQMNAFKLALEAYPHLDIKSTVVLESWGNPE